MLTKVKFFADYGSESLEAAKRSVRLDGLVSIFGDRMTNIRPVSGGTLGFALLADLDGRPSFLKTNAIPQGEQTLAKEFAILNHLYGSSIHLEKIQVHDGNMDRHWMIMDEMFYPPIKLAPDQVLAMSESISEKLDGFDARRLPQDLIHFDWILQAGDAALRHLASHDMLDAAVQRHAANYLNLIAICAERARPVPCHGDLGPLNIMMHDAAPVAIDWEDAFFGFRGYDYLYWLTFFENRKYYSRDILGHTSLGKQNEIGLMALILLIKSDISFRSQKYANNKITFNQRIEEVLVLS